MTGNGYIAPDIPKDEDKRLEELHDLELLDYHPRYFDEEHRSLLRRFADLIENEIAHDADLLALKRDLQARMLARPN